MSTIVVIQAHPNPHSFGAALANSYSEGARGGGAEVEVLALSELRFDPILHQGYQGDQPLEDDLLKARALIERADHLVFQFPVWWGSLPALLKGFIDRTFLPGWAFRFDKGASMPTRLLDISSARILATMDSPWWWYRLKHGRAAHRALVSATLNFIGVRKVDESTVYALRDLKPAARERWLQRVNNVGAADAARLSGS